MHHIVGLTYAYVTAALGIGAALTVGALLYGLEGNIECGIACVGDPSIVDVISWTLAFPISAIMTFVMVTVGAAAVLALPPFIVVPAYVLAIIASRRVKRPCSVAAAGATLAPLIGIPTLLLWHHFTIDPSYRGSLSATLGNTSPGVYLLASVAGATIGFAITRRELSASSAQ